MIVKVDKDKPINNGNKQLKLNEVQDHKILDKKDEDFANNGRLITPEIPKADLNNAKKPPINLRIHNTKMIEETVPIQNVVGLAFRNHILDENFKPKPEFKNKRYRKVWKWIQNNPSSDKTFKSKSITLAKVKKNEYYVIDGVRRISTLKYSQFEYLHSQVVDYTDIYDKILDRKNKVNKIKSQSTNQIIKANTNFKPKKLTLKPTTIKKDVN